MARENESRHKKSGRNHNNNNNNHNRRGRNNNNNNRNNNNRNNSRSYNNNRILYPDYTPLKECLQRYAANNAKSSSSSTSSSSSKIARGKLRTNAGGGTSFVSCDRGIYGRDLIIDGEMGRNRAIDGDIVFVEIISTVEEYHHAKNHNHNNNNNNGGTETVEKSTLKDHMKNVKLNDDDDGESVDTNSDNDHVEEYDNDDDDDNDDDTWQEDERQRMLWDPIVPITKRKKKKKGQCQGQCQDKNDHQDQDQYMCRVIHVLPPHNSGGGGGTTQPSELNPTGNASRNGNANNRAKRTIVGTLKAHNNKCLFVPNSRSLPRFLCPASITPSEYIHNHGTNHNNNNKNGHGNGNGNRSGNGNGNRNRNGNGGNGNGNGNRNSNRNNDTNTNTNTGTLYKAEYIYGSWPSTAKWPPCTNVKAMGQSCNIEDETNALLIEYGVNHGDFISSVLKDVDDAVRSGRLGVDDGTGTDTGTGANIDAGAATATDLGWAPTPDMYKGRRDYRKERIFTIDPTTAKDLDDALHIRPLGDGKVEIGVHIADVSHFVTPDSHVDYEAARRTTTVYLVDRVIPMLPRPLCEIACSLNENVERLAFSCVWTMNMDGTLAKKETKKKKKKGGGGGGGGVVVKKEDDVWYGRTVIKSCARLDYATAQNIIDGKVATGETTCHVNETYWPKSRQPTGGHTIDEVAHDVRLMHKVAMARRKLRFENGALALNGVKLAFQMGEDGETPALCAPYPIRDSNRLIEEYMLLANYLVAQRLLTHAGGLAVLRQHAPPLSMGLQKVIDLAAEKGFVIDGSTSRTLQESLSSMSRHCDDKVLMQCVTEMLMTPMRPAEYIASGEYDPEDYAHFALNIPYYTHFTSPIRRYPDVLVHRLLQATLDGPDAVEEYAERQSQAEIQSICNHCNDKRLSSKKAQDRSDRVFLSLFLKAKPIKSTLGVVVSIGEKAFTVYVPRIGVSAMVYLDKNSDTFDARVLSDEASKKRSMVLVPKDGSCNIDIKVFSKIAVACYCKMEPPIDVTLKPVGPWSGE